MKISNLRLFSDRWICCSQREGGWWAGEWGGRGWGQQWGCLQPLRTALHTISISLQNSLSWKALRPLNARWAIPVYPVFEDEKLKALVKKSIKRKIALKKTDRSNIILTNFCWEQLETKMLLSLIKNKEHQSICNLNSNSCYFLFLTPPICNHLLCILLQMECIWCSKLQN